MTALKTALRAACAELREHNADYDHRTPPERIAVWERLADEPEAAAIGSGSGPMPAPGPRERWIDWLDRHEAWIARHRAESEQKAAPIAELGGQAGTSYAGGSFPGPVQDERVPTDDEVEMTRVRYAASCDQPVIILRPGDESPSRPCCARVGEWWCVAHEGHDGDEHEAPPDRDLPAVDFGPRAATTTRRGQP